MEYGYAVIFYTIGSLPVAWLLGKMVGGYDIRDLGSGNAGVMNVALQVSRWVGLVAFAAEAAKGALVVFLARRWELSNAMIGVAVVAAVVGTRWSIWIYGAGGRGNTLGVAALLALAWPTVGIGLAIWLAARLLMRSSFWATRLWILSLPIVLGVVMRSWPFFGMGLALGLLYLSGHKSKTDDHTLLKESWPNLLDFITAPRRSKPSSKSRG